MVGLLLAVGTPVYLGFAPLLEAYLLHPAIFTAQAVPYVLAGALWIPHRAPLAASIGLCLAGALVVIAALLYVPMLTGLLPVGGDMVALAFIAIDAVTVVLLLVTTLIAHALLYARRRGRGR